MDTAQKVCVPVMRMSKAVNYCACVNVQPSGLTIACGCAKIIAQADHVRHLLRMCYDSIMNVLEFYGVSIIIAVSTVPVPAPQFKRYSAGKSI